MSPFCSPSEEFFPPSPFYIGSIFTIEQEDSSSSCRQVAETAQKRPRANGSPASPSRGTTSSVTNALEREIKQKCANFCDNLAFAMRNKLFIMGVNLRRRLRQLTKFVNRKLDHHRHNPHHHNHQSHCRPTAEPDRPLAAGLSYTAVNRLNQADLGEGPSSGEYIGRPIKLTEPLSVDALGVQQERILSRLERMKRVSHKYSSRGSASPSPSVSRGSRATPDETGQSQEPPQPEPSRMPEEWTPSDSRASESSASSGSSRKPAAMGRADRFRDSVEAAPLTGVSAGRSSCHWAAFSSQSRRRNKRAKVSDSTKDKKTCIVCYERPPNILTLPCEHSDICSVCFIEIIYMAVKNSQYPLKCVLCRQRVERIRCSRRLMLSVCKPNRSKTSKCNLFFF